MTPARKDASVPVRDLRRLHDANTTVRVADGAARRHGLDPTSWQMLVAVALTDREAIMALGLAPPNASRALTALETKGLIKRRPDPADGRRKMLEPTPGGWQVLRELAEAA